MIKYAHITSYLTTIVMLALFVCGFLLPPVGVIDNSVIQAGGELMGLAFIAQLPRVIRLIGDRAIRIKKGDFSIEASDTDEKA